MEEEQGHVAGGARRVGGRRAARQRAHVHAGGRARVLGRARVRPRWRPDPVPEALTAAMLSARWLALGRSPLSMHPDND